MGERPAPERLIEANVRLQARHAAPLRNLPALCEVQVARHPMAPGAHV